MKHVVAPVGTSKGSKGSKRPRPHTCDRRSSTSSNLARFDSNNPSTSRSLFCIASMCFLSAAGPCPEGPSRRPVDAHCRSPPSTPSWVGYLQEQRNKGEKEQRNEGTKESAQNIGYQNIGSDRNTGNQEIVSAQEGTQGIGTQKGTQS